MKIFLSFIQKRVSLTSNRLVLDNASVHGSQSGKKTKNTYVDIL
jgi:hypothetical protein